MALGLLCFLPGLAHLGAARRRFHGGGGGAWFGWGTTLSLCGFGLATQVAQIADGLGD